MAADYITLNGVAFRLGGSISTKSLPYFVADGIEQGIYRKYPKQQKAMLTEVWKLANPSPKKAKTTD